MENVFVAKIQLLRSMLEWIRASIIQMEFDHQTLRKVELASEEVLVNIIQHGYQDRPEKIEINVKVFPKSHVEITIKDYGPPFDPLQRKEPNYSEKIEEREVGGLGIHLIRQNMDEVRYKRESGANILILIKKWTTHSSQMK
jgi:sigma-B regulation protein RsbU (phosphoserine phosphatase)